VKGGAVLKKQRPYPTRKERFFRHLACLGVTLFLLNLTGIYPLVPRQVARVYELYGRGRVVAAEWTTVEGLGPVRGYLLAGEEGLFFCAARFDPSGWESCGGPPIYEKGGPLDIGVGVARRMETYSDSRGGWAWTVTAPVFLYGQVDEPRAETLRVSLYLGETVTVDLPWEDWVHKDGKDYFLLPISGGAWSTNDTEGHAQLLDTRGQVLWEGDF